MPGLPSLRSTFGRKNTANTGELRNATSETPSNSASNGEAQPNLCDGTCNCPGCEKKLVKLAGSNGNGRPATHEQNPAVSDASVNGGSANNENQPGKGENPGCVQKTVDGPRRGLRAKVANRVSQVGSSFKRRTFGSRSQSEDALAVDGAPNNSSSMRPEPAFNSASPQTSHGYQAPLTPSYAPYSTGIPTQYQNQYQATNGPEPPYSTGMPAPDQSHYQITYGVEPNAHRGSLPDSSIFPGFPSLAPSDKQGQAIIPPTIAQVANGEHVNNGPWVDGQRIDGQWTPNDTGTPTAPTQAGNNGFNDPSSIQATPEEGTKDVPLRVIPWDVGNDPDHHKVRPRGSAALVHAGVPPLANTIQVMNRNSDYFPQQNDPQTAATESTTTHLENTDNGDVATAPSSATTIPSDSAVFPQFRA